MAKSASDALQRAADRAKRRADLEVAKIIVERNLGYEIDENTVPWVSVLSMPQRSTVACESFGAQEPSYDHLSLHVWFNPPAERVPYHCLSRLADRLALGGDAKPLASGKVADTNGESPSTATGGSPGHDSTGCSCIYINRRFGPSNNEFSISGRVVGPTLQLAPTPLLNQQMRKPHCIGNTGQLYNATIRTCHDVVSLGPWHHCEPTIVDHSSMFVTTMCRRHCKIYIIHVPLVQLDLLACKCALPNVSIPLCKHRKPPASLLYTCACVYPE